MRFQSGSVRPGADASSSQEVAQLQGLLREKDDYINHLRFEIFGLKEDLNEARTERDKPAKKSRATEPGGYFARRAAW